MPLKPDTGSATGTNQRVAMGPRSARQSPDAMLRAWHLAILRLAVTRENADRLEVFAIAQEIDRPGGPAGQDAAFSFFRRTSASLCEAILRRSDEDLQILHRHLESIDNNRLRQALVAALELEPAEAPAPPRRQRQQTGDLWKGLTPRAKLPERSARR